MNFSHQVVSLAGAFCVLLAYISQHAKWMRSEGVLYNALNVLGAGLLAYVAVHPLQIGFLVMEGIWAALSCVNLCKALYQRK